jgi:hypothetical protein
MTLNEEVAIKQEILEISVSSLSDSTPTLNAGSSRKRRRYLGPEKKTVATKSVKRAPQTAPKPGVQSSILSNKLTVAQKDALRLAFAGHNSVPSLTSRNAWASANNLKGEAVHRYCRYLRDRSKQNLVKQEPSTEPQVEAEWHLSMDAPTSVDEREAPALVLQTNGSKFHQPDLPTKISLSMPARVYAVDPCPITLQMPDFSFLSNARFFDLLIGPEAITYDDLHDPITFCLKFQEGFCSLDMEAAHETLRTMYFFEGVSLDNCRDSRE